jgi:hypothetical protein
MIQDDPEVMTITLTKAEKLAALQTYGHAYPEPTAYTMYKYDAFADRERAQKATQAAELRQRIALAKKQHRKKMETRNQLVTRKRINPVVIPGDRPGHVKIVPNGTVHGIDLDKLWDAIEENVKRTVEPLRKRIAELATRPASLEYCGVWRSGAYQKNQCVTFDGSLWIALCNTPHKPGTDKSWQLCVKRGRDGKDAKS